MNLRDERELEDAFITAGLKRDPNDSPYRLAEAHRTLRARAQAQERGFEALTPDVAARAFGKGASTVRRAMTKGLIPVAFSIQSRLGGPVVRLVTLEDARRYWGNPDVEALDALRAESTIMGIYGVAWAILGGPLFKVERG